MSGLDDDALDRLLGHHPAPSPAAGLAERIRAEATRAGREPYPPPATAGRPGGASRRRWARPRWWIGVASVNLALVGAAAASIEVAHHGLNRLAAIPAALFHRVGGTPTPRPAPHHALTAPPAVATAPAPLPPSVAAPSPVAPARLDAPATAAPSRATVAGRPVAPVSHLPREFVRPGVPHPAAALAGRRASAETPRIHHRDPAPSRVADRHAERPAADRGGGPEGERANAADARAAEAAKVRDANLASGASIAGADARRAPAAAEAADRGRGLAGDATRPDRPFARGTQAEQWRQWRQQMQQWRQRQMQQHLQPQNRQPPDKLERRGNAGKKGGGRKDALGRRRH